MGKTVILVTDIDEDRIKREYLSNIDDISKVEVLTLYQNPYKKTPVKEIKQYLTESLYPLLEDIAPQYVLVGDAEYFKAISGKSKADPSLGYVEKSKDYDWHVVYIPNYKRVFYNPDTIRESIKLSLGSYNDHVKGKYIPPGSTIIKSEYYPEDLKSIKKTLDSLIEKDVPLTIDIEAFSLKHPDSGIGSIAFAWNKHEGISFKVDTKVDGVIKYNEPVRQMLRDFFFNFNNKTIYHNICFDVYVLIYQLYMDHLLDMEGFYLGRSVLLKNWECTKLISYLATNTVAGNDLKLKSLAREYAGNWAADTEEDIKDITLIPLQTLLRYNLVDTLSTWFVMDKNYPIMVNDNQLDIYTSIFKPAAEDIIMMQLMGIPLDMNRVNEVEELLSTESFVYLSSIKDHPVIREYEYTKKEEYVENYNNTRKVKRITLADVTHEIFNANSNQQIAEILYDILDLPVIDRTKTKAPSAGGKTLKKLTDIVKDESTLDLLNALISYKAVDKLLTTFVPAMKGAYRANDDWYYLFGYFNLGGTVSGRLSSSNPNLQNLPAKGNLAKLIKSCFVAPPGWVMVGLDFDSLEDKISALTTQDPNKIKVYTDGFCGHCLRAYAYFKEQMPDIIDGDVKSINSIESLYPDLRQDSKIPTFLLTYGGTWRGMMKQAGIPEDIARSIESNYHRLYEVSDKWVANKIQQASNDGYVTGAFGLRVRTPLLKQTMLGTKHTPYEAESEGRTAGNALGQSWCLLNDRAGAGFIRGYIYNESLKYKIKPIMRIHDAQYFLVREEPKVIEYVNINLVKECSWQDHPDIQNDKVKLSGKLSIFFPTWNEEIVIPNGALAQDIYEIGSNI